MWYIIQRKTFETHCNKSWINCITCSFIFERECFMRTLVCVNRLSNYCQPISRWKKPFYRFLVHPFLTNTRKITISLPIYPSKSFWNSIRILAGLKMNAFCIVSLLIFIPFLWSRTRRCYTCEHALTWYFPI